ncbi:MAG: lipoprotein signal peptidase [Bacteroidia bacterium]|nr:lipoprotein signal peptidase [Bacteroidia bacterium]NNM15673.1 lipoprotein signal peptidase [Bacteroidia bacterium]
MKRAALIIFLIVLVDQILKFWIKTNMMLQENIPMIGDWFNIYFIENKGMAFGLEIEGTYGKLFLSLFRIFALGLIGWYLRSLILTKHSKWIITGMCLVFAGALGNIIDSTFYGILFSASTTKTVAEFLPAVGYETLFHGNVVDMFYFPIIKGYFPEWLPWVGGDFFIFFRPIFNIADASISVGVVLAIISHGGFFEKKVKPESSDEELRLSENGISSDIKGEITNQEQ